MESINIYRIISVLLLILSVVFVVLYSTKKGKDCPLSPKPHIFRVLNVASSYPLKDQKGNETGWIVSDGYPAPSILFFGKSPPDWIKNLEKYSEILFSVEKINSNSIPLTLQPPFQALTLMSSLGSPEKPSPCVSVSGTQFTLDESKISSCEIPPLGQAYACSALSDDNKIAIEFWLPVFPDGLKSLPSYLQSGSTVYVSPNT